MDMILEKNIKIISVRLQERFENSQMYYLGGDILLQLQVKIFQKEIYSNYKKQLLGILDTHQLN